MRSAVGIAGVSLLLAFAGEGILLALGVTRLRVRELLASLGLAYLAGVAACMLIGILLLVVGVTYDLSAFAVVALAVGAAGAWFGRRRAPRAEVREERTVEARSGGSHRWLVGAGVLLLVVLMLLGLLDSTAKPLAEWDGWSIWTRKAVVLANSGLDLRVFASDSYAFSHLDYPILLPLFESLHFRAMGVADGQALHAVLWILFTASLAAVAYLGSRVARFYVWFPVVLAVAVAGQIYGQLLTAYADVPFGLLAAPGVLAVGLWLQDRDRSHLIVGALLLAAAASVKNEGLLLLVATFVALGLVLLARRAWRLLVIAVAAAVGAAVLVAPWRIWISAHHLYSDLPISKGLSPGYLLARTDRIAPSVKAILGQLESGALGGIVPVALALVVVALATARIRGTAAFYLLAALGTLASVLWAFMITPAPIDYQLLTSVTRVVMGVVFVSVAAVVQLGGLLDRASAARPADDTLPPEPAVQLYEASSRSHPAV